ncbi:winged helix DNA-binding domain-containing protein [Herbiconiux sp. CPCC 203407]|uniref:Winged helix DNA-binding domain-containing protein n=1 Tax=Herbiconiux oxytropis TaxID=2970915 RepID=A0AA41XKC2_9MICO|nr:winged helix DNA-binding domain-containing protein [Herbiconiux oxytropis]MCS5722317.1 winged helix DNA-binding domain-containing protein [Herbiconiux oxytropis]MCS5727286.1 winged helix DNA-binding domain-containing protein [Herbiconiux oxytropis]
MAKRSAGWSAGAARDLLRRRLAAQWIAPPGPKVQENPRNGAARITAVTERMLALQAQDYGQAVWALGVRAPGSTRSDVEAALDAGTVVRSWPMRGTLHVSTPDDLRLMLSITAARTIRSILPRYRQLGLDDDVLSRARAIATTELRGGGRASRDEFFALLTADGIEPGGQRGTHVIGRLAHEGLLCWGPTDGGRQQLVILDEWAPPGPGPGPGITWPLDENGAPAAASHDPRRTEALGEFVRRYLAGRGPATLKDFCWWSKVTVAEAKRGLDHVRDRLTPEVLDGAEHWTADDGPDRGNTDSTSSTRPAPPFHALPGFDEFLLGYPDRAPALAPEFAERIVPGNNGVFLPMLVAHGTVVGTWRRRLASGAVTVTLDPFEPLSATARAGFTRAMLRYADFLGLALVLDERRLEKGAPDA